MPVSCKDCSMAVCWLNGVKFSARRAWWKASRFSHRVMATDEPTAPASTRVKFDRLLALAMRLPSMPANVMAESGRKNVPMAKPRKNCGSTMPQKSICAVSSERHQKQTAYITKLNVTTQRISSRLPSLPMMGASSTGMMPTGATASPDQVAV